VHDCAANADHEDTEAQAINHFGQSDDLFRHGFMRGHRVIAQDANPIPNSNASPCSVTSFRAQAKTSIQEAARNFGSPECKNEKSPCGPHWKCDPLRLQRPALLQTADRTSSCSRDAREIPGGRAKDFVVRFIFAVDGLDF
jgi:hypothetical protein